MRKLILFLSLLCPLAVFGQGAVVPIPPTLGPTGAPKAGATISFCVHPANANPCTNYQNAYSDAALTQLINQTTGPLKTDGLGNSPTFYAAPGQYDYTLSGAGISTPNGPYVVVVSCIPGSTCVAAGSNNAFTGNNTHSGTETFTGLIQCKNFENIRCVDAASGYSTIEAALSGLTSGTVLVVDGFSETITTAISITGVRVLIMPNASLTIGTGGSITLGDNATWEQVGGTITVSATSGNAITFNGGWARFSLGHLTGPGSGTGNGLVFKGAQFSEAKVGVVSGFPGGKGLLFTGIGASQGTLDNVVYIEHNTSNGTGVLWQGESAGGDQPCEDNRYFGGLVNGNTVVQVQFGDANSFGGYLPQYNKFYGVAHSTTGVTPVVFQNATLNWFYGSALRDAGSPSITFSGADNNFVHALPLQQGPPTAGTTNSWTLFQSTGSSGFDAYGFGLSKESGLFLLRDRTNTGGLDYWWEQFTPNGGITFFGGANAPANPLITVAGALQISKQFTSTLTTGTAPFSVASTTPVANLSVQNVAPVNVLISPTAPTISAHFNTSGDSISANNGTAAFTVTVGTGAAGSTGAVGLPTAATGWICFAANRNRGAYIQQTGSTTTTATFTNYGTTVGTPVNWTNSDVLAISCFAY